MRECKLKLAESPNTATIGLGGQFLDYQLTGGTGVRLRAPGWSATETLAIGLQDEEEWDDYEHGYILADFECGAKANTCEVEFEDETVTTDDHGVVDKDDTDGEWRWECHSDNGTVRQCSALKDGG